MACSVVVWLFGGAPVSYRDCATFRRQVPARRSLTWPLAMDATAPIARAIGRRSVERMIIPVPPKLRDNAVTMRAALRAHGPHGDAASEIVRTVRRRR